ncbi:response regulator transcription factor [Trichocoleus sp. FACHB-591]|nr:response regulator transcription factor [Trichocoleus sp. FACHB-591]
MSSNLLLIKGNSKPLNILSQVDFPLNHALTHVAQETAELLQHIYSDQSDDTNSIKTVAIRAIEPEYMQVIAAEPLTQRELEVLQLIVDGYRNPMIAEKLHIAEGTVKIHVRNILKKLCADDRTQAAIRALRSGLVC